ncbi:ORF19 protein [Operophtera brumata nucleopolyhedrovirus]|uniref:ORF19 protein n=1 Tax=Operophtera brumata nucleopolyhedrovirus TaxID=1046267 RepID=A0A2H4UZP4_9ABAC|nr:ORF19 protein [Operophtera brumata nucleopolyhedrovirus]AUA60250.1 ORF19 protein [Operophtera brumata nucleopolyhedrovirus]
MSQNRLFVFVARDIVMQCLRELAHEYGAQHVKIILLDDTPHITKNDIKSRYLHLKNIINMYGIALSECDITGQEFKKFCLNLIQAKVCDGSSLRQIIKSVIKMLNDTNLSPWSSNPKKYCSTHYLIKSLVNPCHVQSLIKPLPCLSALNLEQLNNVLIQCHHAMYIDSHKLESVYSFKEVVNNLSFVMSNFEAYLM